MLRNPFDQIEDPNQKKLLQFRVLLAAVILGGVLLCSGLILGGLALEGAAEAPAKATQQASFDSVKPLKELCAGGAGNPAAASYTPGAGPHRLVVFRSNIAGSTDLSTFYIRTEDYPEAWRAAVLEEAALVACVSTGSSIVEECAYTLQDNKAATLQRVQLTAQIKLYAARTGELVAQGELAGTEPRACGDTEQFVGDLLVATVTGEAVTPEAIAEWLREYVQ
jgi:hypothetical protein